MNSSESKRILSKVIEFFRSYGKEINAATDYFFKVLILCLIGYVLYKGTQYYSSNIIIQTTKSMTENETALIDFFNRTQSFITVATGLLTLIIGATSIGAYISFRKIKDEENRVANIRNELEILLSITQTVYIESLTATGSINAIKKYNALEKYCETFSMFYILRGEEYYYLQMHDEAKKDFIKALDIDKTSARAWFGLGQVLFRMLIIPENMPKESTIWSYKNFYSNSGILCIHTIEDKIVNNCINRNKRDEAISALNKANLYGYDESKVEFEIGRIYDAMDDDRAIVQYKKSYIDYKKKNVEAALFFCTAWIRKNMKDITPDKDSVDLNQVIEILIDISSTLQSSLAYALLCYIYCITGQLIKAERVFTETNDIAINELFYLPSPQADTPCPSS